VNIKIENGYFIINGKKQFIISGEVQYFRLKKENWQKIVSRLKEANCNTLSTYVPWNWHEYEKGKFDFEGKTHPSRDLKSFLDIVKANKLYLIIKIGPHIHAEFLNGGIPVWLIKEHPEILCLDCNGKPTSNYNFYPPITYLHPVYMKYVKEWFEEIIKILLPYDNIIMWQVDNEVSYNISFWGYLKGQAFTGDYNPFIVKNGLYQKFLKQKYNTIEKLNKRYNEKNRDFSEVKPPVCEPVTMSEHFKVLDWIEFREVLPALYVRELIEIMYSLGCRGPFVVNDPLLSYTSSWRGFYEIVNDPRWQIVIGYTCYHGNVNEENISNQLSKIEYTYASGTPVVANMEIQAGDAYFLNHWKQDISDYNLVWKIAIGAGANIINYYWFADGENFENYHYFIPEMNFNSPVDKNGKKRVQFELIKNMGKFLKDYPEIVETQPVYDLSVGFYHLYGRMAKFYNKMGIQNFELTTSYYFIGSFLDLLSVCNIRFQLINLEDNLEDKIKTNRLVVLSYKFLDKDIQNKLVSLVHKGLHLILLQNIPVQDANFQDCKILWEILNIKESKTLFKPSGTFEALKVKYKDYYFPIYGDVEIYKFNSTDDIEIDLRMQETDEICGFTKKVGKGKISVIGFVPRVFLDISRKFARDYFNKKSEDKILIYERANKNFTLYTVYNLYEKEKVIKIKNKKYTVPPRDAIFVVEQK